MFNNREVISNINRIGILYQKFNFFHQGEITVRGLTFDRKENLFHCSILDRREYETKVELTSNGNIVRWHCECSEDFDMCNHIIATLQELHTRWDKVSEYVNKVEMNGSVMKMMNFYSGNDLLKVENQEVFENTSIEPIYNFDSSYYQNTNWLEFKIGSSKKYVMKKINEFLEAHINNETIRYGKGYEYAPYKAIFDEKSQKIIDMLTQIYQDEESITSRRYGYYYESSIFEGKKAKLTNSSIMNFFEIMKDEKITFKINGVAHKNVIIKEGRPEVDLKVEKINGGFKIILSNNDDLFFLDETYNHMYSNGTIYIVDDKFSEYAKPLFKCFKDNEDSKILISENLTQEFFSNVLPCMDEIATIKIQKKLTNKMYNEELVKKAYFDKYKKGISAKVIFNYGNIDINPNDKIQSNHEKDGKVLLRKIKEEKKILNLFQGYSFEKDNELFFLTDDDKIYEFLNNGIFKLQKDCEVFYSEQFKNISVKAPSEFKAGLKVNLESGMLELNIEFDELNTNELMDVLLAYKLKQKYHKLKNGQFISLDSENLKTASDIIDQLDLKKADLEKKVIELPKYRAMYLDKLTRENKSMEVKRSGQFKKMVQDVLEPRDLEFDLPKGIKGELRDYQITGFKWLKMLSLYGFGGILADDMGLGKTLQVITFIKSEKENGQGPSLVVAPTSLVYNWREEVEKFAPDLKIIILAGLKTQREENIHSISDYDIVVTSYGKLKRDMDLYSDIKFNYCFIDEAQNIKNPKTLNAKAVKDIKAKGFFALTGTPVENSLTELWSIFDFIMPGYLYSHGKFSKKFEKPIIKESDIKSLENLSKHITPFILRRMKKDVLKELPDKIESKMINKMEDEQKKIYLAHLMKAKKEFAKELSTNGFQNSRIKILALLTRLRQICCHPSLFIENYNGKSGKIEMLKELLVNGIESGHKILVFSQFTSMLALIKDELNKFKIKYNYLDGSTSSENRIKLVKEFNANKEIEVFLISLKAGGTGLNLTGADMVIHVDPWWNPAVEDQATDRAYRIGQDKAVQVFKLITKDTIEEKIFKLQQKKKELVDSLIKPGENLLNKMSEDEMRELFD